MSTEQELYHYGVKGMKWGIRKKRRSATDKDERRKARKKSRQQLINRGRAYVKNLVDGFNEGVAAELANQQQQRQIQQGQQWFMNQQMQFNRQSGSLAVSGGTNPFMFG